MSKKLHELKNEGLKKIFVGGIAKACGDREPESLGEGDRGRQLIRDVRAALEECVHDEDAITDALMDMLSSAADSMDLDDYIAAQEEMNV